MKRGHLLLILSLALAASAAAGAAFEFRQDIKDAYSRWRRGPLPVAITREEALRRAEAAVEPAPEPRTETVPRPEDTAVTEEKAAPPRTPPTDTGSMNLKVLFVPQSPFKKWDARDEDACEEAAIIMMRSYVDGTDALSLEEIDREIEELVEYESRLPGYGLSITAEQTAALLREKYGITGAKALPVASPEEIRRWIAGGGPVIVPAAGKLLENPNFKNGGPLYHMLVIKGFASGRFITNDPGTRLGADYVYDEEVLWEALHDWNGGNVYEGKKMIIVVE